MDDLPVCALIRPVWHGEHAHAPGGNAICDRQRHLRGRRDRLRIKSARLGHHGPREHVAEDTREQDHLTHLLIEQLLHGFWAIDRNPIIPSQLKLEQFAILLCELPQDIRCMRWRPDRIVANEWIRFWPKDGVQSAITTNPSPSQKQRKLYGREDRKLQGYNKQLPKHHAKLGAVAKSRAVDGSREKEKYVAYGWFPFAANPVVAKICSIAFFFECNNTLTGPERYRYT